LLDPLLEFLFCLFILTDELPDILAFPGSYIPLAPELWLGNAFTGRRLITGLIQHGALQVQDISIGIDLEIPCTSNALYLEQCVLSRLKYRQIIFHIAEWAKDLEFLH